ncbi:ATP-binding protein [Butyrivibrio sp. YAB3001]|uniref:ATP-binding protein n=1 Tax=Butyrivibrio sp. YAB3001 TaxID=1520812 RepID=UPI0008F623E7|nr:DUF87 domain-containing protein [Butyrivibrio sp. YAB3001]SFC69934.1 AAA-like domain-containing protein [Butyrivibrio sp. YAB3001]
MKYVVNSLVQLIENQAPTKGTETIIRVDGFESLEIYENFARRIVEAYKDSGLKVDVKLTKTKMDSLEKNCDNTTIRNSLIQNKWVIQSESVTYYRNLHESDLLILLGTETEEDKGGLDNCFTITPDILIANLNKNYNEIFELEDCGFSESECDTVDALFKNLFEYVPVDICKLSSIADRWKGKFDTLQDFIELFYSELSEWGLPGRKHNYPTVRNINSSRNVLKLEHDFISGGMFTNVNKTQYEKYLKQIEKYGEDENREFSDDWEGWSQQAIKSYDELSEILRGFIIGSDFERNVERFLHTDFAIIEAIFGVPIEKVKKQRDTVIKMSGEPLEIFTRALLISLTNMLNDEICADRIVFNIKKAEIVSWAANSDEDDVDIQLLNAWKSICRHTNGAIELLDSYGWSVGEDGIQLSTKPENIFDPSCAKLNIDTSGVISAASTNKTLNKVIFDVCCYSEDDSHPVQKQTFQWNFEASCSWNHYFGDLCEQDFAKADGFSYIPLTTINKLNPLLFTKSSEEFFDAYEERELDFSFNICDFVDKKIPQSHLEYSAQFDKVGRAFAKFAFDIAKNGYYTELGKYDSSLKELISSYGNLGEFISKKLLPENMKWILDAYIHSFNIETSCDVLECEKDIAACIVPPWHPAALEKLNDQKIFFLDGCYEWWQNQLQNEGALLKEVNSTVDDLLEMSTIQSSLDLFPSYDSSYFGARNSYDAFSLYGRRDIENTNRLKDMIRKDAIFDDDFDSSEIKHFNDNAKMIYGVLHDYMKAFPNAYSNLSIVFLDPSELQPIIAAIYRFVDVEKNKHGDVRINIELNILVKPENKGGRNYLAYWMDEAFSQDSNVNIHTYLNEYETKNDLERLLDSNNDIIFAMDILRVDALKFLKDNEIVAIKTNECRFPIVYKPSPMSETSVKRKIELSQPQFRAAFEHTQVVRYRNNMENAPVDKYIAYKEVRIDDDAQEIVFFLHTLAYWVVCIDSGMDGALLRSNDYKNSYQIIGFSTGKGEYGQYNLTITARKTILETIKKGLDSRLYKLFRWTPDKIEKAAKLCLEEASGLDGISLLSAINPKDRNINEFMAYVLTSLIEKEKGTKNALKIVVHLDSYKHWFSGEIDKDDDNSMSRPDFLVLEANTNGDDKIVLNATIVECKIAGLASADSHKMKAVGQVRHGIRRLSQIFDPNSKSVKRRYWYAQLYRALVFAQVTFSNESADFEVMSAKLRAILDGNFEINWNGRVLGFWLDLNTEEEVATELEDEPITVLDIPQIRVQKLLLENNSLTQADYVAIDEELLRDEEEEEADIKKRQRLVKKEMEQVRREDKRERKDDSATENHSKLESSQNDAPISVGEEAPESQIVEKTPVNVSDTPETTSGNESVTNESDNNIEQKTSATEKIDVAEEVDASSREVVSLENIRVLVGKSKMGENVFWEFGNKSLANRHLLITGTSGQGKTYSIQTMLYELSKNNVSSVVFDYTEGFRLDQLEQKFVELMGDKVKQHIIYSTGVPINPFKRHEIEVAGMSIVEKPSDVANRIANIFTHVYKFGEQQYAAIFEAARMGIEEYKEDMNMLHFLEKLEEVKSTNQTAKTVISKMTPFFHSIEFDQKSDFDWGKVLYSEEPQLNIFQLTLIDREMQVAITELMLWDAWYFSKKYGSKEKPFVVVLDEAQNLSHKSNSPSAVILTEGRKFGWSAWFATQSTKILADDEVTRLLQAAFKLYFKPTDDEVTRMAKQLDPSDGNAWLSSLKGLKKGQCIAVGERIKANGDFGQVKPTITNVISFEERN